MEYWLSNIVGAFFWSGQTTATAIVRLDRDEASLARVRILYTCKIKKSNHHNVAKLESKKWLNWVLTRTGISTSYVSPLKL